MRAALLVVSLAACGRVGFDAVAADATSSAAWVDSFVVSGTSQGTTDTFTAHARAAGDAIIIHAYCLSPTPPTAVAIDAPGWTFIPLGMVDGSLAHQDWAVALGAIAPDTASATFTVTWSVADCPMGTNTLGDEITGVDPSGATFYASTVTYGTDDCVASVDVAEPGDAVWGACSAGVTGAGAGFTKSGDDSGGDWTEWAIATAAGAMPVRFTNMPGKDFIETAVAIRHR